MRLLNAFINGITRLNDWIGRAVALLIFVMFAVLGRHRLVLSAALALVLTFAYHFFFKGLLNVPLPSGAFGL